MPDLNDPEYLRGLLREVVEWKGHPGTKSAFLMSALHGVGGCSHEEAAQIDEMWKRVEEAARGVEDGD